MASEGSLFYSARMVFLDPAKKAGSTDTLGADSLPSLMKPRRMKDEERKERQRKEREREAERMRHANPSLTAKKKAESENDAVNALQTFAGANAVQREDEHQAEEQKKAQRSATAEKRMRDELEARRSRQFAAARADPECWEQTNNGAWPAI